MENLKLKKADLAGLNQSLELLKAENTMNELLVVDSYGNITGCSGNCHGSCVGKCGGCGGSSCRGGLKLF